MKKIVYTFALICFINSSVSAQDAEQRVKTLQLNIPDAPSPIANYVNAVRVGNLLFLSGKGPLGKTGRGKLGADLSIDSGYAAARSAGIAHLAVLRRELGSLNKVKRIVKVTGMVNCTPDFTDQPKVINGYSDLMVEVFGERGKHARSAVGMAGLPDNIAVEVEVIVELETD